LRDRNRHECQDAAGSDEVEAAADEVGVFAEVERVELAEVREAARCGHLRSAAFARFQ
jgi:hypothetical protein